MLLQPALLDSSPLRAALFGPGGSGKTITAMLLALGVSIERHNRAPLAFVDPEGVEEFIAPLCAAESVPLVILRGRTFVEMCDGLTEAEQIGCCAYVVDHYDGIFRELTEAQKTKLNLVGRKLPYQHREELIRVWDAWVRQFRASSLHCIFTGRLAWEWGDSESEDGETEKVKIGTKMRGDSDAGYEPNLLIEMERLEKFRRDKVSKRKQGEIAHVARVIKDRRMILNGRSFEWKDLNAYTQGDYKPVYNALAAHLVARGARADLSSAGGSVARSSAELFVAPSGESAFSERARRVSIAVEELQGALNAVWPGSTNDEKKFKAIVLETLFQSRSWTKIETLTPEILEDAVTVMRHFELDAKSPENDISNEAQVIALIASCRAFAKETQAALLEGAVL